ncbi:DUF4317 family protein [Bacillus sp. HMF5848]|uniref:DUF4317 domain-containing protein n=1 Tax=Bacillus sp. HMF5848 TaxID=2495421 RepID=UPI000F7AEEA9|nr:DUF4317 domain-containing protein [Bacillus sp. HMF5848]RSK28788.1 DUF4317 family protein [Bacillus sp. HMF5848]
MNRKDIANIRKQFKIDNYNMKIHEILNVYVKKETGDIYHYVAQPFEMLEQETQELFLKNFKKVLTGQLDAKLFELKFRQDVEDNTQEILLEGMQADSTEDWTESMLDIVGKMVANATYEFDTIITFIRAEYRKPTKKRSQDSEEGGDDEVYTSPLILCSMNKIDQPQKTLLFDYIEKEFKPNTVFDPIINLTSPLAGFLFPAFKSNAADVNHILYCAGKVNQPSYSFIEDVLSCGDIITAAEESDTFEEVVKQVAKKDVDTQVMANVYEEIDRIVKENEENEESEAPKLDYRDIERILTVSGVEDVDTEKVESAFKTVIDDEKHEFKANNLVPKSIKITTKVGHINVKPHDLKNIKYITFEGKRCLLLEVEEEMHFE